MPGGRLGLVRVVRPGGRIALVESCHVQCRIDGGDFLVPSATVGVANPAAGLQLRAALLGAGCNAVRLVPTSALVLLDRRTGSRGAARGSRGESPSGPPVKSAVASALGEMQRRDEAGRLYAVMMLYVAGTVVA